MTPTPTVTVTPAPVVVQPEDTVTVTLPRRSAEVLLTILSFIGGPYGDGEPRTRMDQLSQALINAGLRNAQHDLTISGAVSLGRYPVGLRIGWRNGKALIPSPSQTGGMLHVINDHRAWMSLQHALNRAQVEDTNAAREARQAEAQKTTLATDLTGLIGKIDARSAGIGG